MSKEMIGIIFNAIATIIPLAIVIVFAIWISVRKDQSDKK